MANIIKRFDGIPDHAITSAIVVMTINLESEYNEDELTINKDLYYTWNKIDEFVYDLNITYEAAAWIVPGGDYEKEYQVPIYVNINVYFINDKKYYVVQSEGN